MKDLAKAQRRKEKWDEVEDKVIVEIKSVEAVMPVHKKQLLTYLRLTDKRLGLLINFGENLIKDGITRVANKLVA
jgi:GxxExxY protein